MTNDQVWGRKWKQQKSSSQLLLSRSLWHLKEFKIQHSKLSVHEYGSSSWAACRGTRKRFLDADNMIITSTDNLSISRNRKIIFRLCFEFHSLSPHHLRSSLLCCHRPWGKYENCCEKYLEQVYFNYSDSMSDELGFRLLLSFHSI